MKELIESFSILKHISSYMRQKIGKNKGETHPSFPFLQSDRGRFTGLQTWLVAGFKTSVSFCLIETLTLALKNTFELIFRLTV